MQFIDLEKQQKLIKKNIEKRIKKVLDHGKYIMGPEVEELERHLKDFTKAKEVISCANGTDAIMLGEIYLTA